LPSRPVNGEQGVGEALEPVASGEPGYDKEYLGYIVCPVVERGDWFRLDGF
jgi:hypothetical protein